MASSTGSVTASLTLSAFGQTIASSGSSTSAYQYGATSGYWTEGDAGLTLVGCRFYDAQVGRFITRDTYLDEAAYVYCDGDPVNLVDEDGHAPKAPSPKKPGPKNPAPIPYPWPEVTEVDVESSGKVGASVGPPMVQVSGDHGGGTTVHIDLKKAWPKVPRPKQEQFSHGPFSAYRDYLSQTY